MNPIAGLIFFIIVITVFGVSIYRLVKHRKHPQDKDKPPQP